MALRFLRRRGVGVVEIFGVIGGAVRVPVYNRLIDALVRDRRLRAVVVDIDSPGGSAAGSEVLYASLRKVAQEKPVVAYIRGLGASGGYYLSCAATRVVAIPSSLVGSIGVIYLRPTLQDLLAKLGVSFSVHKWGHLKDMGGFWRSPTSEEEAKFKELIEEIYDNFIKAVAHGRGMDEDKVREYATGEVITRKRAQEMGLVDELGDFDRALDIAAELGGARPRPVWVRPRRPFMERMFGHFGGAGMAQGMLSQLEGLLAGGIYYIEPHYLPGGFRD